MNQFYKISTKIRNNIDFFFIYFKYGSSPPFKILLLILAKINTLDDFIVVDFEI